MWRSGFGGACLAPRVNAINSEVFSTPTVATGFRSRARRGVDTGLLKAARAEEVLVDRLRRGLAALRALCQLFDSSEPARAV